jgi:hypothetical protein
MLDDVVSGTPDDRNEGDGCGTGVYGKLIRLNDVPKLAWIPPRRRGSRLAIATVHRWCSKGRNGIRLRHVSAGGTRCTTEAWLMEFFEALAGAETAAEHGTPVKTLETSAAVRRRSDAAARALAKEGF